MSTITAQEIEKVADLAQISLTEGEKEMYTRDMQSVLGFFDSLAQVDTQNVSEIGHITGMEDVYRDDVLPEVNQEKMTEKRDALLANVPTMDGAHISVKNVL